MAKLDINGYNATFRTFVEFAEKTQRDGYDSACEKARAILANVKELREAAKGDEGVFKAGIDLLEKLDGKSLPPWWFVRVLADVKKLSVDELKNVRPGFRGYRPGEPGCLQSAVGATWEVSSTASGTSRAVPRPWLTPYAFS